METKKVEQLVLFDGLGLELDRKTCKDWKERKSVLDEWNLILLPGDRIELKEIEIKI